MSDHISDHIAPIGDQIARPHNVQAHRDFTRTLLSPSVHDPDRYSTHGLCRVYEVPVLMLTPRVVQTWCKRGVCRT
jgi:hypothetical protein